jgi:hypothetical protein
VRSRRGERDDGALDLARLAPDVDALARVPDDHALELALTGEAAQGVEDESGRGRGVDDRRLVVEHSDRAARHADVDRLDAGARPAVVGVVDERHLTVVDEPEGDRPDPEVPDLRHGHDDARKLGAQGPSPIVFGDRTGLAQGDGRRRSVSLERRFHDVPLRLVSDLLVRIAIFLALRQSEPPKFA